MPSVVVSLISKFFPRPDETRRRFGSGARVRFARTVLLCLLVSVGGALAEGGTVWAQENPQPDTVGAEEPRPDTMRVDTTGRSLRALPPSSVDSVEQAGPSLEELALDPPTRDTVEPAPTIPDTGLVDRYLPSFRHRSTTLFTSRSPLLGPKVPPSKGGSVALDSTGRHYRLEDGVHVGGPMRIESSAYRQESYRANLRENWSALVRQRQQQRSQDSGFGVSMTVPGGRESTFTTVFGKPQVDLRVTGQADINAGFKYSKNDQQGARTGDATQLDPSFKQDLRLGITGTIGDKMKINVDWDTKNQFDYQNQVKLEYTGYDDDIIQKVEAGNVFLETPSQLISGGQSLFGIKSTFQLGNFNLTTIASQQEGQSNSLSIEGGAEKTEFSLQPTDYDEDAHFFLGYYFRNNWNRAHRDPTTITLFDGFNKITDIEVWKLQTTSTTNENADVRRAAAVVDLGESPQLVREADGYTDTVLPGGERDQYTDADLEALRDGDTSVSGYVESSANLSQPLESQDWTDGKFKKLERGRDYRLDTRLGFLSLKQRLRSNEALAVSFRYRANGQDREVGDFSSDQGGTTGGVTADRLVLKLLRPPNPVAPGPNAADEPPAWFLEMRNIYRLSGRGFNPDNFELDIEYNPSGQGASTTIPEIAGQTPLLQVLGLDRVDQTGAPSPDNEFDFTAQTIDREEGLIYFPYLEPFGARIFEIAGKTGNSTNAQSFAFPNLYLKKKSNAEKEDTEKNVFQVAGSYKGQAQGFYDLQAFTGLVDGSVEVTSGGQTLKEGTDYVVDYQSGTVNITNQTYLTDGREINISYEQQSIANLQKKTLLGARADWSLRDQFALGATIMRLSQKSPVDKYRIGEEPIQNTIWGVDGSMQLEPRWLTRAVDALPLVQTRAESELSVSGEFAQLRPGHTTTEAFQQTVEEVQNSEKDSYAPDERNGVSYVDDFEGFENTFSLKEQLGAWQVSAAPDSIAPQPALDGDTPGNDDDRQRTHWRGSFGWYELNQQIVEDLKGRVPKRGEAAQLIDVKTVFPDRDTRGSGDPNLRTLDVYFDPWERGAYNYTPNLEGFIRNPERVWGGMTRRLPEGYTDFSVQNVEFVEFIVKVYPEEGPITDGSKLYVNLGTISEDVIPNEELNTEDGLPLSFDPDEVGSYPGSLSRIAAGNQNDAIDIQSGKTEDLGLDGLVSYSSGAYAGGLLEQTFYADFVGQADSLLNAAGQLGFTSAQRERLEASVARIKDDPSADDYHHYENDRYFDDETIFPNRASLQERFSRYYAGHELNGFESQNRLAQDVSLKRGVAGDPDTEDLDGAGGRANITNNYFQYAIPLDSLEQRAETDAGPKDYVVSKVGKDRDWYKVRIPVREFTDRVGNIDDFKSVESIRLWTSGHASPVTMRFASLELVGSQWRKSPPVSRQPVENGTIMDVGESELRVASINNEEDPGYEAPVGAIISRNRTSTGQRQRNREQSLLLNVEQLKSGQQRGVFKTFQQGLDLLKYSNLRMYTHVHGASNSPQEKEDIRENLRLFVRLGANETGDYYEYEQPLQPSNVPGTEGASSPWLEDNEMNLVLSALSQLKTARDQSGVESDTTFTTDRLDLPLDFAPQGTRLKIRGTPSLNNVKTVVIGVRHAGSPQATPAPPVLRNVEVWVNELRVSGFDERKGWATNSSANVSLADLATVQGSFQRSTDGFGSLSSTLNQREQADNTSWSVRTDVNLDALLPKQQGWSIPVTMQVQSSLTSPRFDPQRGDVRITEIQDQFDILPDSTIRRQFGSEFPDRSPDEIRQVLKDSVRNASESYNFRRTLTADLSKSDSDSWWMRQTVDATSLNFSYFDRTASSPQRVVDEQWNWSGSMQYQLDFGQPRTLQPLGFLPDVFLLGTLGDVEFNYAPTSLSFSGSAERQVTTTRNRPSRQSTAPGPARINKPFRENQNFSHRRNFSLQYDPFGFLNLSFDTNTQQTLSDVGARTETNLIFAGNAAVRDTILADVDTAAFFRNPQAYLDDVSAGGDSLRSDLNQSIFVEERLGIRSEGDVFNDLFFGDASPRTNSYRQRLSATLQLGILDRKALNWIDVQDVSYQSSFNWDNGAKGSLTGASVQNSVTLRSGVSLKPNKVWERFDFFQNMKEAQRTDGQGGRSREPESDEESDGEGDEDGSQSDDEEGDDPPSFSDLPLPDPVGILRRVALTFMDINDLTINYNGDWSARSSNVGTLQATPTDTSVATNYSLLDAARGDGPSLGYRLGLSRSINPQTSRIFPRGQSVFDNLSNQHRFEGRTALTPSSAFNIDLNWNVTWSRQTEIDFQKQRSAPGAPGPSQDAPIEQFETEGGNASASVWAFGSYQSFFESQLAKLQQNASASGRVWAADDVALTKSSVAEDFRDAYLTGGTTFGSNGFIPLPMPGWTVRYSGLSDWPLVRSITKSVSLNHSYNATYETGFNSISTAGDSTSINVVGQDVNYVRPDFEPQSSRIQEQFQPLIGVDITWPFDLQTSLEWNRRIESALRGTNVVERKTGELSGRLSYSKRGLSIPFLPRIENRVQLSLTVTRSVNNEREFLLNEALSQAQPNLGDYNSKQALRGDNVNPLSETTRLTMAPKISYSVSNRVTADFRLEYERFDGDSRQPSYTNINGTFNVSVSLSQN